MGNKIERFINNNSHLLLGTNLLETEKSYCAAFVDGEGTITLRLRKEKKRGKKGYLFFDPRIITYNNEKEVIDWLRKTVGHGTIKPQIRSNGKIQYRWVLRPQEKIKNFLSEILPYLRINRKRRLAKLLLEWIFLHQTVKQNQKINTFYGEKYKWNPREFEIVKEVKELNKK